MTAFLNYYRCRHCATWAVVVGDGPDAPAGAKRYVHCNGCGGAKKWEYRQPATEVDAELIKYATAHGVAHLPIPQQVLVSCVRCEKRTAAFLYRPDGRVCLDCYRAEEHPPVKLLTPEEVKAVEEARRQATKNYDHHHQFSSTGE